MDSAHILSPKRIASPGHMRPVVRARPFLKWAGGKTQLLDAILGCLPQQFGRYYEPFVGGGAVFFALQPKRATLSDVNCDLIKTWQAIRDQPLEVIKKLRRHRFDADYFYKLRKQNSARLSLTSLAARLIYLNRTCYNGLYRVNRQGRFNVPWGHYKNPTLCNAENLLRVSAALQHVTLRCQDVGALAKRVRPGDLVYLDPPYVPLNVTSSFVGYAKSGFGLSDQVALAALFKSLAQKNVFVLLSNSNTSLVKKLYKDYRLRKVFARRSINSNPTLRGRVAELLISSF